jgi:hypothetical protein
MSNVLGSNNQLLGEDGRLLTNLPAQTPRLGIGANITNAGDVIAVGQTGYVVCQCAGTITRWDIVADQAGLLTVDVWKAAGNIPTNGNKISATAPIKLDNGSGSNAQIATDSTLSGWTKTVAAGDVFGFYVSNTLTPTNVTKVTITVTIVGN